MSTMRSKELPTLNKRIRDFKARKAREFPELGLDDTVCTDYENYHISEYPKLYRQTKQLIKWY
jgi:hypothetical protein